MSNAAKNEFNQKIADQKKRIADVEKEIGIYRKAAAGNAKMKPFFQIGIASKHLQIAHLHLDSNEMSETMMSIKNSTYLDSAKKEIGKSMGEIKLVVTGEIDEPLDFNRDQLDSIKPFDPKKRLNLYKHLKHSIQRLIDGYGTNTKWKWSFPDMWASAAIIAKNLADFREIESIRDPRETYYYDRQELLTMIKNDLFEASNQFRDKFELSTKANADLLMSIKLLEALRRIASLTNDQDLVKKTKSGIESYRARLEAETKDKK